VISINAAAFPLVKRARLRPHDSRGKRHPTHERKAEPPPPPVGQHEEAAAVGVVASHAHLGMRAEA
jgi:hypothetical protein